jgi:hypothetical protein
MDTSTVIVIAILVLAFFAFSGGSKKTTPSKRSTNNNFKKDFTITFDKEVVDSEATAIANRTNTTSALEKLFERLESAEDRLENTKSEDSYTKLKKQCLVLEKAIDIAESKPIKYIFLPEGNPLFAKNALKKAYKLLSKSDVESLIESDEDIASSIDELTINDLEDDEPVLGFFSEIDIEANEAIIKLRTIVEGKSAHNTKIKNINLWVNEHKDSAIDEAIDWWFSDDELLEGITAADLLMIEVLGMQGLPDAHTMYHLYDVRKVEDCLKVDPRDYIKLHGVGPAYQKALIEFQSKVTQKREQEAS